MVTKTSKDKHKIEAAKVVIIPTFCLAVRPRTQVKHLQNFFMRHAHGVNYHECIKMGEEGEY